MTNMEYIQVVQIEKLDKGKRRIRFENGGSCIVYYSEIRGLHLEEGAYISLEMYEHIFHEIVGKRAKKRALHLLEQMDRTEQQLRENLQIGDEITTIGGIMGRIVTIKEDSIIIETGADRVKMRIMRWAVQTNNTATEKLQAEREAAKKAQEEAKQARIEEAKDRKNKKKED